jgi:hypothetical protein
MQFPLSIKPELRANFDYVFLLADDTYGNQKRIYEHYAGVFPSFELCRQIFIQASENHDILCLNNCIMNGAIIDIDKYFMVDIVLEI